MKLRDHLDRGRIPQSEQIWFPRYLTVCDYYFAPPGMDLEALDLQRMLPLRTLLRNRTSSGGLAELVEACRRSPGEPHILILVSNEADEEPSGMRRPAALPSNAFALVRAVREIPPWSCVVMCRFEGGGIEALFEQCRRRSDHRYVIVQQSIGDDRCVDEPMLEAMPRNVTRIYTKNRAVVDERVVSVPIGRDIRNAPRELSIEPLSERERSPEDLLYCNFALDTNRSNREPIFERFRDLDWVTTVPVEGYKRYPLSQEEYLRQLRRHRFCLSPEGAGLDCYRTWEALFLKTIPIVQRSVHMSAFHDLPILFTDDYREVTRAHLEGTYAAMLEGDYDFEKLHFRYWQGRIDEDRRRS